MANKLDKELIKEANFRREIFLFHFRLWSALYYVLLIVGILLSAIATILSSTNYYAILVKWFSGSATLIFTVVLTINPKNKSIIYHQAYETMDSAIQKYKFGDMSKEGLIKAIQESEESANIHKFA